MAHYHKLPAGVYHKLSLSQKQGLVRSNEREDSVPCPHCDTKLTAADLIAHVETRCPGQLPAPPARGRYVSWREARAMGVAATTLSFWARTRQVRYQGDRMDRRYLLRDLALKIAQRHGFRRR